MKVPEANLKSAGNRSFHFQAVKIQNSLLTIVRNSPSLSTFNKNLKTQLFNEHFSLGLHSTFSAQFDHWMCGCVGEGVCVLQGRGGGVNMITDVLYSVNMYIRFGGQRFELNHVMDFAQ